MLLRPPALKKGDAVYLLSTARKVSMAEIEPAIRMIEDWGLKAIVGKTIGAVHHQYAGDDDWRRTDFQTALDAPQVRAILCCRGGYGTVRFMDHLNWDVFMQQPKWIIGYSDVTYLHTHITNTLGIQTLHAAMAFNFGTISAGAAESLRSELFGHKMSYETVPHPFNRTGGAEGILIGGNLSILYSITGTHSGINTFGKILFIEDLDEYLYHIDRMMMNLKRSGKLDGLAALVVGGLTNMRDNEVPFGKTAEEIVLEHVQHENYPVCFGFPAGHVEDNRALVMGRTYQLLITDSKVQLQ